MNKAIKFLAALIVLAAVGTVQATIDDPVLWYTLQPGYATTSLIVDSGSADANITTSIGGTNASDGWVLNGAQQLQKNYGDYLNCSAGCSFGMWVKPAAASGGKLWATHQTGNYGTIFGLNNDFGGYLMDTEAWNTTGSSIRCVYWNGCSSTSYSVTGSWTYYGVVFNVSANKILTYMNGTNIDNYTFNGAPRTFTGTRTLFLGSCSSSCYLNGTIANFRFYDHPLSTEEQAQIYALNYNYTPPAAETPLTADINITFSNTTKNTVENPRGLELAQFPAGVTASSGIRTDPNYFWNQSDRVGASFYRINGNFNSKYPTFSNSSGTWYGARQDIWDEMLTNNIARGKTTIVTIPSMDSLLGVSNTSFCSSGSSTCYPASYSTWADAVTNWFIMTIPGTSNDDQMIISPLNEIELTTFFGNNLARTTANAPTRAQLSANMLNALRYSLDTAGRSNIDVCAGQITMRHWSTTDGTSSENDTQVIFSNQLANLNFTPNCIDGHIYVDNTFGGKTVDNAYDEAFETLNNFHDLCVDELGSSTCSSIPLYITEIGIIDAATNNGSNGFEQYYSQRVMLEIAARDSDWSTVYFMPYANYQETPCYNASYPEYPRCISEWEPMGQTGGAVNRTGFNVSRDAKLYGLYNVTQLFSNDNDGTRGVVCEAGNGDEYVMRCTNIGSAVNVGVNFAGIGVTNITNQETSYVWNATNGYVVFSMAQEETAYFTMTVNASDISFDTTSPSATVNIAEPSSQEFSFNLTNPSGQTYSVSWYLNGVARSACFESLTCTLGGNYTSNGTFAVNATVVGETNTISYEWTLTVNNTAFENVTATINASGTVTSLETDKQLYCSVDAIDTSTPDFNYQVWLNGALNSSGSTTSSVQDSTGNFTSVASDPLDYNYVNTTIPDNATAATWQTKHGDLSTYNITVPDACISGSVLQRRIVTGAQTGNYSSQPQCYNGTAWEDIGTYSQTSSQLNWGACTISASQWYDGDYSTYSVTIINSGCAGLYDWNIQEGTTYVSGSSGAAIFEIGPVYWTVSSANGENQLVATFNKEDLSAGDNLTLSCQADDGTSTSSYVNSTTITMADGNAPTVAAIVGYSGWFDVDTVSIQPGSSTQVRSIVTDDGTIDSVFIEITRGSTVVVNNVSMTIAPGLGYYYDTPNLDTEGVYIATVYANDTEGNTGSDSATISVFANAGGGGGGGAPETNNDVPSGSSGSAGARIETINATFSPKFPLINTFAWLSGDYKAESQEYIINTNKLIDSCVVASYQKNTTVGTFSCYYIDKTLYVEVNMESANEPLATVFAATVKATSNDGEQMEIPIKVTAISVKLEAADGSILWGKAFIIAAIVVVIVLIGQAALTPSSSYVKR